MAEPETLSDQPMADPSATEGYRVLARKYRPRRFADLIGQDMLVATLTNAMRSGRIAQAFLLTGVRGTGKTTTARIIARALNCIGPDGQGGPTADPCGVCTHCTAIGEDRHVDVLEMDAASRTGVNDIRNDVLDSVRYRPASARYKIYIIDEIHMLSTPAFNALLKTLEEPPDHVKFIFATTEIRKVPVTVLSRCQRFDLRRIDMAPLAAHLGQIAKQEGAYLTEAALTLLARAADGSVRDGLSLLDQVIAHHAGEDGAPLDEPQVRDMLGLADRSAVFDLFETIMRGRIAEALDRAGAQYALGADPAVLAQDLLELCHFLTRIKVAPKLIADPLLAEAERVRGQAMARDLSMAALSRTWQMLLKGLNEIRTAPIPLEALNMLIIRLGYAADLPDPASLIRDLEGAPRPAPTTGTSALPGHAAPVVGETGSPLPADPPPMQREPAPPESPPPENPPPEPVQPEILSEPHAAAPADSLADLIGLAESRKELRLADELRRFVHFIDLTGRTLSYRPADGAPRDLEDRLRKGLKSVTGQIYQLIPANSGGAPTEAERMAEAEARTRAEIEADPLVTEALALFPGAEIKDISETERDAAPDTPDQDGDETVQDDNGDPS